MGGDEFICSISDADVKSARNRFRLTLAEEGGASETVGLAVLEAGDTARNADRAR